MKQFFKMYGLIQAANYHFTNRKDLVSLGSFVAVRSDQKSLQPYWLYEVLESKTDTFLGNCI